MATYTYASAFSSRKNSAPRKDPDVVETNPLRVYECPVDNTGMYLRRNRKKKEETEYEYWSLVQSVRSERDPRQRVVATIGKLPGLDKEERIGWEEIGRILSGKPRPEAGAL